MSHEVADEVLRLTARLNRWVSARTDVGVPTAQARLLGHIDDLQPVRITTLALADHSSQPGVTAQVNRLESAGLVRRIPDESDARASLVELTEHGRAALTKARGVRAAGLAPLLDQLDAADLDRLRAGVAVLSGLVDRLDPHPDQTTP
ncbi:MarR family winged helix-turn-helix transcriptional regulator [Aestuariimicrobium soli]|uniref:MarR family winged helix-turn-helix transcriptional regulator n=1 Tax=Aestuariimicrobium soli TaxID=2035834 RepID=UPI003EB9E1F5